MKAKIIRIAYTKNSKIEYLYLDNVFIDISKYKKYIPAEILVEEVNSKPKSAFSFYRRRGLK